MSSFNLNDPPPESPVRLSWKNHTRLTSATPQPVETIVPEQQSANRLCWGQSRSFLEHLICSDSPEIELAYLDPPFASLAKYSRTLRIHLRDKLIRIPLEEYSDIWNESEYLQFIYEHLVLTRSLLSDNGSIVVHCDWHQSHHIRCVLDMVFGTGNFQNELVFAYGAGGQPARQFPRKHDILLWYRKNKAPPFNSSEPIMRIPYDESTLNTHYRKVDKDGRRYRVQKKNGQSYVSYADQGKRVTSVWTDIKAQLATSPISSESTGYPTQKPEHLLERIISGLSTPNSWFLDPFVGSGTSIAVADRLGRNWLGSDINLRAIETTRQRLGQRDHRLMGILTPETPNGSIEMQWKRDVLCISQFHPSAFASHFNDSTIDIWPDDWPYLIQCIDLEYTTEEGNGIIRERAKAKEPITIKFKIPNCTKFRIRVTDYMGGVTIFSSEAN